MGVTSSSGPGMSLKTESLDLAISTELPLVVINTQRAGPSTGMPTKTEQADLLQALYGRHGDSALVVLAARSPADCFEAAILATQLAIKYMTPVLLLSDNYIANASEPWNLPDVEKIARFPAKFREDPVDFHPYERDSATLARPWAIPGTPGLEHRIGGLERDAVSGNISYDPANHQRMTELRATKIARIAEDIPEQVIDQGPDSGPMVVVGWGSSYGPISRAVGDLLSEGVQVSHVHLRHIWPLPRNLGDLLGGFERVLVPEMNMGQLVKLLRSEFLVPAEGLNKVSGKPFMIAEIEAAVRDRLEK
jgi:2-oxoglutarate ferredoxin oxidoreductase subunit alpha